MANYVVSVVTVKTNSEMTFSTMEKSDALNFANYYRRKNSKKDKKYDVKMKSI